MPSRRTTPTNSVNDQEAIDEIAKLATSKRAIAFVKGLKEYFRPAEIVLVLRAMQKSWSLDDRFLSDFRQEIAILQAENERQRAALQHGLTCPGGHELSLCSCVQCEDYREAAGLPRQAACDTAHVASKLGAASV